MTVIGWTPAPRVVRISVLLTLAGLLLTGCAHLENQKQFQALQQVQPGDTEAMVVERVGAPDRRTDITPARFVVFYQNRPSRSSDEPLEQADYTPIAFENGKVVAVDQDLTERWTREEAQRLRQSEMAEREQRRVEQERAARLEAAAARQKKIEALEAEVRPIPASNAAENLRLYRQLLELDPDNPRYRERVGLYEARLAQQEAVRRDRAERAAREKQRQAWDQARDARNQQLRQYTGNDMAEMAVHDMGNGSLYVWLKNVSRQIFTTHPDHFSLVDSQSQSMPCQVDDSLDRVLEPGGIAHGRIAYSRQAQPGALVFENREAGRIIKPFQ
ncbi:MAG: hypothetical protein R6W95_01840 [Desulfosarcina sp.]